MRPLTIGPRLSGFLVIVSTALAVFANLFDVGLTGAGKFVLGSIPACLAVFGTVGNLRRDPQTAERLFWPLAVSLAAGASIFGVKQLLIDTGRLYQTTDSNLLHAYALSDFPLFVWTAVVGGLWLYSTARLIGAGRLQPSWFATLESRPATVRAVLAAITGGAAVIRFWAAGRLGLWSDEGIVYIAARNILKTGLPYLETKLLYLRDLPHLYAVAGSLSLVGDTELGVRLPSLIAGILLVPLTYLVTEKLFERKSVSLLAAAIVAVHPWMIEYSRFGRSYMLMLLLLYLAVYFFLTGLESRRARFGLAAAGFLAALTHQVGQIALMLAFVALLDKKWRAEPLKWWPFLGAAAGVVVYKVLFSYGYFFDQDAASAVSTTQAVAQRIPFALPRIDNLFVFMRVAPFFLLPAAIAASIRGRLLGFSDAGYRRYAAWFGIIIIALVFSKRLVTINRGILFFFPILAAATALLLLFAVSLVRSPALRATAASLMVIMIAGYGAYGLRQVNNRDYGTLINPNFAPFDGFTFAHDNKTTIEYVNKRYRPGDQIIVLGSPNFWVAYSKHRPDKRVWTGSSITLNKKNVFVGTPETGDLGVLDKSLRGKRTWVVTSFSTVWTPRIGHVAPHLVAYIDSYSGQRVYVSKDVTAKVYLIDRRRE